MKKLFYVLMASLLVAGMASCEKPAPTVKPGGDTPGGQTPGGDTPGGNTPGGNTPGTEYEEVEVILKTAYIEAICDWPEENDWKATRIGETRWDLSYDEYGHIVSALVKGDKEKGYLFDYNDDFTTCDVTTEADENIVIYNLKLNDKGLCTQFTNNLKDPAEVWTYTYDADGFQLTASIGGEVKISYVVQNKNVFTWSRDGSRLKEHKYDTKDNVADIHTSYSEDAGLSRFLYETGLFGRSSEKVCTEAKWQDRDAKATFEYEYDEATGGIVKEVKYYAGDYDFDVCFAVEKKTIKVKK